MPLWESNEIYFVAGLSVLVTLGVFASVAYFVYRRAVANGRRADEEQAALEKVLLRKEAITTSPPTKPLIVSPSFSSPNKVPARHLRSGSYSPTHYLSPYHSRQPRRNSSPTSNASSVSYQPKLPSLQLHHPQLQQNPNDPHPMHHPQHSLQGTSVSEVEDDESCATSSSSSTPTRTATAVGNSSKKNEIASCRSVIKSSNNSGEQQHPENNGSGKHHHKTPSGSLAQHNSQYYGTIPPRRMKHGGAAVAPESHNVSAFLPLKCGAVIGPHKQKSEYAQLPGRNGADFHDEGSWKNKDDIGGKSEKNGKKWKNHQLCSPPNTKDDVVDGTTASLRRKVLLQKQYQQNKVQQNNRQSTEPPGELFKMKHQVTEEIPYYISTQ